MKRTERHHLKENELHNLARQAREGFETRLMDEGRSEEGEKVEHVEDSHEPI